VRQGGQRRRKGGGAHAPLQGGGEARAPPPVDRGPRARTAGLEEEPHTPPPPPPPPVDERRRRRVIRSRRADESEETEKIMPSWVGELTRCDGARASARKKNWARPGNLSGRASARKKLGRAWQSERTDDPVSLAETPLVLSSIEH